MAKITYLPAFADKENPEAWRVEGRNEDTGEIRISVFGGPEAEKLAVEYHAFKTGKLPIPAVKSTEGTVPQPTWVPTEKFDLSKSEITIITRQGHKVTLYPDRTEWSYDVRKNQLTAFTKPAVELVEKGVKTA
jgi:hypothetical protein